MAQHAEAAPCSYAQRSGAFGPFPLHPDWAVIIQLLDGSDTSAASYTFNLASDLAGTCLGFSGATACGSAPPSSSSVVSSTLSMVSVPSSISERRV